MLYISHYECTIIYLLHHHSMCKHSYFKYKNEMQSNKLNISSLKLYTLMFEISRRYKTEQQLCAYKD